MLVKNILRHFDGKLLSLLTQGRTNFVWQRPNTHQKAMNSYEGRNNLNAFELLITNFVYIFLGLL